MINWLGECCDGPGLCGSPELRFSAFNTAQFRRGIDEDKLIKFTPQQLKIATDNFSDMVGIRGNGTSYRGVLSNETVVAVQVLRVNSDKKAKGKFMAELNTFRRVRRGNLVQPYGFCLEKKLRALVHEYIAKKSLDKYLFHQNRPVGFEKPSDIAVGTARGVA